MSSFRVENNPDTYRPKSYDLSVIKSKLPPDHQSNRSPESIHRTIDGCSFLKLITELCLDAGYVLSIVCNLDSLPKMLSVFNKNNITKCVYSDFINRFMDKFGKFKSQRKVEEVKIGEIQPEEDAEQMNGAASTVGGPAMGAMDLLADKNPILYLVFEETFKLSGLIPPDPEEPVDYPADALVLFKE